LRLIKPEGDYVNKKSSRLNPGNTISMIVVVAIFCILYLPTVFSIVSSLRQPEKIELSLVPYGTFSSTVLDDLRKYGIERTGVKDYTANIYLSFETSEVEIGKAVKFHLEIDDIEKRLDKPYFYVFLVNNTGNVVSAFPEEVWLSTFYKLSKWVLSNDLWTPRAGGDSLQIPRQTLIAGQGDCWKDNVYKGNCEIWYKRQIVADPSQIGRWEVWVFLFDEQYKTLDGKDLPSENAITYTIESFDVTPKRPPEQTSSVGFALWLISSTATVIVSAYGMFRKVSPWINVNSERIVKWWHRNRVIIVIAIIAIVADVAIFLLRP
jgi:hypothetical protein